MRRGAARRLAVALGVAVAVHLLAWVVFRGWPLDRGTLEALTVERPDDKSRAALEQITVVELARGDVDEIPQIPLAALLGPADEVGVAQTHPNPDQAVDLPGQRAASRGGGATAGETAFTERHDPTTDVPIRHEPWNAKRDYQSVHDRTGRKPQSPEAIRRDDRRDVADRAAKLRVASAGELQASNGLAPAGRGTGAAEPATTRDERDAPAGTVTAAATEGAIRPNPTPAMVDPGTQATDTPKRADTASDDTNAAAASRETRPGPYEITPPTADGSARSGVRGDQAPGQLGTSTGTGTAATQWGAARGKRDLSIQAEPQDPYFRTLFTKLERAVVFPRQLALELRAGRPIAELVLRADGTIAGTAIAVSSGTAGFDRELIRAIGTLKRLPPPPASLLAGKPEIRVRVEWAFDPGILR